MNNDIRTVPLARKLNRARKGERKKLRGKRRIRLQNWRENSLEDFKKRVAQLEKEIKEKEKNENK